MFHCFAPGVLCGHQLRAKLGVRYVDGWCLGVRRGDWERIGGYDDRFEEPPYWADVDLSFRAEQMGFELRGGDFGLEHERSVSIREFRDADWFRALKYRNLDRLTASLEAAVDHLVGCGIPEWSISYNGICSAQTSTTARPRSTC